MQKEYKYIDTESKELFDLNVRARALTKNIPFWIMMTSGKKRLF